MEQDPDPYQNETNMQHWFLEEKNKNQKHAFLELDGIFCYKYWPQLLGNSKLLEARTETDEIQLLIAKCAEVYRVPRNGIATPFFIIHKTIYLSKNYVFQS